MEEIILKERELKEKIINDINASILPFMIIEFMLQDILKQVQIAVQKEYSIAYQNAQEVEEQAKKRGGDKKGK